MSYDRNRMKLAGDGSRKVDTVAIRDATQQSGKPEKTSFYLSVPASHWLRDPEAREWVWFPIEDQTEGALFSFLPFAAQGHGFP